MGSVRHIFRKAFSGLRLGKCGDRGDRKTLCDEGEPRGGGEFPGACSSVGQNSGKGSYVGRGSYTVVTAAYNVQEYLSEYFESILGQTLSPDRLRVIVVDDGSTDDTASVAKRWADAFPDRITCVCKDNGGPASARNVGLSYVETDWVTFIDADDYVAEDYFEQVDRAIFAHADVNLLCCKPIIVNEAKSETENTHPLRYRFENGTVYFAAMDESIYPIMNMAQSFMKTSLIRGFGLVCDEELRPNFEDAHFIGKYLACLQEGLVGFASEAIYYYRKRKNGTSLIDTAWDKLERLTVVPERGYLDLARYAKKMRGHVPRNIQQTLLYDLSWYFKHFVGREDRCRNLVQLGGAPQLHETLRAIFSYIEIQQLLDCPPRYLPFVYKAAIAREYMGLDIGDQTLRLRRVGLVANELQLESFSPDLSFWLNGERAFPFVSKAVVKDFFGKPFLRKWIQWFNYDDPEDVLTVTCARGNPVSLVCRAKKIDRSVVIRELLDVQKRSWKKYQSENLWIVMDRDTQADDNGEHFYRYLLANHSEQQCVFALRKDSPDWHRLEAEGFRLIDFGSSDYERMLRKCSCIISSHADPYVYSYFGDSFYGSKKYVFLQHGVTKEDISNWIGELPITKMLTATRPEYESIVEEGSPYSLTKHEVVLTGLPRYDALLRRKQNQVQRRKTLLFAPTWRLGAAGPLLERSNERGLNEDFADTAYCRSLAAFLENDEVRRFAGENQLQLVFFPHVNVLPYIEQGYLKVPSCYEIGTCAKKSIQEYLAEAAVFVTDFSSLAFDAAYLDTPCIYYQDSDASVYRDAQGRVEGYFNYTRDGFGPVASSVGGVVGELRMLASHDFVSNEQYHERAAEAFAFRDDQNCERAYRAVLGEGWL